MKLNTPVLTFFWYLRNKDLTWTTCHSSFISTNNYILGNFETVNSSVSPFALRTSLPFVLGKLVSRLSNLQHRVLTSNLACFRKWIFMNSLVYLKHSKASYLPPYFAVGLLWVCFASFLVRNSYSCYSVSTEWKANSKTEKCYFLLSTHCFPS